MSATTKARRMKVVTYAWIEGYRARIPAAEAGPAIMAAIGRGGRSAEAVLEAARDPGHVLHRAFTWDDGIAAHQYRLEEARRLLRSIVVLTPDKRTCRAVISVRPNGSNAAFYYPRKVVMSVKQLKKKAIQEALELILGVLDRYRDLGELDGIRSAAQEVLDRFTKGE